MSEALRERLESARWRACAVAPYAAPAIAAATLVITDKLPAVTMACDKHYRVYAHPALTWSIQELAWVWLHETLGHLVRGHCEVSRAFDPQRANIAQDLEIESWEWSDARVKRPQGGLHPSRMNPPLPVGMTWRWYYDRLPDDPSEQEKACGGAENVPDCGSGASGGARPYEGEAPADSKIEKTQAQAIARQVAENVQAARMKGAGNIPRGVAVWADTELAPAKASFTQRLKMVVSRASKPGMTDMSGNMRERRDLLQPRWQTPAPRVAIIADTSGSMCGADGGVVLRAINQVIAYAGEATVYYCDTATHVQKARRGQKLKPLGGGGTDLSEAVKLAEKSKPDLLVMVTDGDMRWPARPSCKHIAIITREGADANGWPALQWEPQ